MQVEKALEYAALQVHARLEGDHETIPHHRTTREQPEPCSPRDGAAGGLLHWRECDVHSARTLNMSHSLRQCKSLCVRLRDGLHGRALSSQPHASGSSAQVPRPIPELPAELSCRIS